MQSVVSPRLCPLPFPLPLLLLSHLQPHLYLSTSFVFSQSVIHELILLIPCFAPVNAHSSIHHPCHYVVLTFVQCLCLSVCCPSVRLLPLSVCPISSQSAASTSFIFFWINTLINIPMGEFAQKPQLLSPSLSLSHTHTHSHTLNHTPPCTSLIYEVLLTALRSIAMPTPRFIDVFVRVRVSAGLWLDSRCYEWYRSVCGGWEECFMRSSVEQ